MEGLIPMVLKTIQKTRTRRHYQYLSSSASPANERYNIQDFYTPHHDHDQDDYMIRNGQYAAAGTKKVSDDDHDKVHHRRHKSFHADDYRGGRGGFSPEQQQQSKKLVRFRSHRFFSCVTGAP